MWYCYTLTKLATEKYGSFQPGQKNLAENSPAYSHEKNETQNIVGIFTNLTVPPPGDVTSVFQGVGLD